MARPVMLTIISAACTQVLQDWASRWGCTAQLGYGFRILLRGPEKAVSTTFSAARAAAWRRCAANQAGITAIVALCCLHHKAAALLLPPGLLLILCVSGFAGLKFPHLQDAKCLQCLPSPSIQAI